MVSHSRQNSGGDASQRRFLQNRRTAHSTLADRTRATLRYATDVRIVVQDNRRQCSFPHTIEDRSATFARRTPHLPPKLPQHHIHPSTTHSPAATSTTTIDAPRSHNRIHLQPLPLSRRREDHTHKDANIGRRTQRAATARVKGTPRSRRGKTDYHPPRPNPHTTTRKLPIDHHTE